MLGKFDTDEIIETVKKSLTEKPQTTGQFILE